MESSVSKWDLSPPWYGRTQAPWGPQLTEKVWPR